MTATRPSTWHERVADVLGALPAARRGAARDRWPRERIAAWQQARLVELLAHARTRSRFWAQRLHHVDVANPRLADIPPLDKGELMAHFDAAVTDPRVTRAAVEAHLDTLRGDALFAGTFRVMASSGSSGQRGLYVQGRDDWRATLEGVFRMTQAAGLRPRWPRRRVAVVGAPDGRHMSWRMGASIDVGLFSTLRLSAHDPLDTLFERLAAFGPDALQGYPSMLALLANRNAARGRPLHPAVVVTSSELRTPEMTAALRDGFGVVPFDTFATTEAGVTAFECEAHAGLHLLEDQCIVEAVDADGRPVPDDTPGAQLLVTALRLRTLPMIRMALGDVATITAAACACGRTTRRLVDLAGRSDDILDVPVDRDSDRCVRVHPIRLRSPLASLTGLAQYQIRFDGQALVADVVAAPGEDAARLAEAAGAVLVAALRDAGITAPQVTARAVDRIAREAGPGKFKLVKRVPPGPRAKEASSSPTT
jgi:phenylacetate-coenzyme A ligase PaaK-like adenylate-forming protein